VLLAVASGASGQVISIASDGLTDDGVNNWADGTWYVRAIQVDSGGNPVGSLSNELQFVINSVSSPGFPYVTVNLGSIAPTDHAVRYFRSLGVPINPGDVGVESTDEACSTASCGSLTDYDIGLSNLLTWQTGEVLPVELLQFRVD
jgi:hypothetical protein